MAGSPRITVVMPVYESRPELFWAAFDSLLSQTFSDFEIVISDNGSGEAARGMYDAAAARDSRVRVVHHPENRGAVFNFSYAVTQGTGEFFMYQADDDIRAPTYLEKTVAALDAHPDAVVAQSGIVSIRRDGSRVGIRKDAQGAYSSVRAIRVADFSAMPIYGLIRRSALEATGPMAAIAGGDIVTVAKLLLQGRCVSVDEELFFYRESPSADSEALRKRFAGERTVLSGAAHPFRNLSLTLIRTLAEADLPPAERAQCMTGLLLGLVWRGWLVRDELNILHDRLRADLVRGEYVDAAVIAVPYFLISPWRFLAPELWRAGLRRVRAGLAPKNRP